MADNLGILAIMWFIVFSLIVLELNDNEEE